MENKNKYFLFCIIFIMLIAKINYCQIIGNDNWQLQSLGLQQNVVKFVDENTGWCCGGWGAVIKTTNGGSNWFLNYDSINTRWTFNNIFFINVNTGFISGSDYFSYTGIILKTTNSGTNWSITNLSNSIYQITFLNNNTGFAASINGIIYKTTNTGNNWTEISTGTTYSYNSINFVDTNIGFVAGIVTNNKGILLKTSNGGNNWQEILYDTTGPGQIINFINEQTGYIGIGGKILKTTNQGLNWTITHSLNRWVNNIQFINTNTGFASSGINGNLSGEVVKTTNGGDSWSNILTSRSGYVHFVNANSGFSIYNDIGKHGIKRTSDGGNTWSIVIEGSEYTYVSLDFNTHDKGWLLSQKTINSTTNGGVSWNISLGNSSENYTSVGFLNNNTGWILGGTGSEIMAPFFRTSNGGSNWSQNWHDYRWYNSIYKNDSNMYVTFTSYGVGYIMRSDEYGNLGVVYYLSSTTFYGINFINKYTGYVVGTGNKILKTTDIGQNWNIQTSPSLQNNYSVYFTDSLKGWIVGERENYTYGDILKTSNGGINWSVQMQINTYLKDIKFVNKNTGWIVGGRGTILYTTNGGNNWNYYHKITGIDFERIYFKDNNTGWFLGMSGLLLRTDNCGGLTGNTNILTDIPSSFSLGQNYPNPFNPSTIVRFSIPFVSQVSLKVYDVMGREVQSLVNERMQAGSYEVKFDGSNLNSGVYFYRIVTDKFSDTKRMLLLK